MIELWENESRAARCVTTDRPLTHTRSRRGGLAMQAIRSCSIPDCVRPHYGQDLCKLHWQRKSRTGRTERQQHVAAPCAIEGCDRTNLARGWCDLHYGRWERTGDPLLVLPNPASLRGVQNCKWQGDVVRYGTAHERVRDARGPADAQPCADCAGPAVEWSYDHRDPDELVEPDDPKRKPYSVKPEHYQPRCRPCHWRMDHPTGKRTRV